MTATAQWDLRSGQSVVSRGSGSSSRGCIFLLYIYVCVRVWVGLSARHNNNRNSSSSVGKMIRAFIFDAVTARALPKPTLTTSTRCQWKGARSQRACVRSSVCVCRADGRGETAALAAVVVVVAVVFFLCFALTWRVDIYFFAHSEWLTLPPFPRPTPRTLTYNWTDWPSPWRRFNICDWQCTNVKFFLLCAPDGNGDGKRRRRCWRHWRWSTLLLLSLSHTLTVVFLLLIISSSIGSRQSFGISVCVCVFVSLCIFGKRRRRLRCFCVIHTTPTPTMSTSLTPCTVICWFSIKLDKC